VKVGLATIPDDLISYLLQEGFVWSPERNCFHMEHEAFSKWNNKVTPLGPISFECDAYGRATRTHYGGDQNSSTSSLSKTRKV